MTDRELDALVAEKVMDDVVEYRQLQQTEKMYYEGISASEIPIYKNDALNPKPYSTDIAVAWEVVNNKKQFVSFDIARDGGLDEYVATAWVDWNTRFSQCSDSAPRAICLAALKAVGVEVDPS
jgi:hypothetical protein